MYQNMTLHSGVKAAFKSVRYSLGTGHLEFCISTQTVNFKVLNCLCNNKCTVISDNQNISVSAVSLCKK